MLDLSFDMLGSTNFARFIYDGDGGVFGSTGPSGSARIEQVFEQYFASQGLATEPTEFDGRSDYDASIAAGIPAGGLFTGAEGIKTPEQSRCTAAPPASSTTRATTRRATTSRTSTWRCWSRWRMLLPTPFTRSR